MRFGSLQFGEGLADIARLALLRRGRADGAGDAGFLETGRTVYQGHLFVGAVPLNESPLKDHPLNPMHDVNLVQVLARQSRSRIGLVDLASVVAAAAGRARVPGG